mmetsp:Transcript_6124/g.25658  ORF Transcript_6124/g.25658 Transcript_6124/m.25658 type:complete len:299 (-) Transcript_6124:558-1454(-)
MKNLAHRQDSIYLNEHSVDCALLAAGCSLEAVAAVVNGTAEAAAAIIRPPGHHATCCGMMGFCLYNNVAVAVIDALNKGVKRILIVDWDVHHGNGTQQIFEKDPRVLFISIHRYDSGLFYPTGSAGAPESVGAGAGLGYTVNIGWDGAGAGDSEYIAAMQFIVLPIANEFSPELIVISAGFDSARGDPLGGCKVTPAGYAKLVRSLRELQSKMVLCLEGGYNCKSVALSVVACVAALFEKTTSTPPDKDVSHGPSASALEMLARTAKSIARFWPRQPELCGVISDVDSSCAMSKPEIA